MQAIDFLPEHYRERRKQCRVRWWWALVVCLFGGIVVTTSSLQFLNVQRIKHEVTRLESQVATVRQLDQHLLEIETKVATLSHSANLYTFLRHPWPRTQILAAVVHPLPPNIELSSIRIAESLVAKASAVSASTEGSENVAQPHPAIADLQQLHDSHDSQRVMVVIEGTAREVETLHGYLEALAQHPLIVEARLNSLETRKLETHSLVVFQLQLSTRPGHGLTDGPSGPLVNQVPPATATFREEALR
ncbi:hypothetical protein ETAA8_38890 [Anatilimnocola aggregata]|uniref:PilN n=1 Tax=Anatilimnocola aggregata TaxID=2528021 RepID=A0A517YEX3_9BACT|nr:hypothetical protein [Anatilimnocola aggregata]QDU28784.1 hypothetical protein ETAA8_38890 [Anatilimnocola aggregata]